MKRILALWQPSLRSKLLILNALVAGALLGLSVQAWQALRVQQQAQARQVELGEAMHLGKQADMLYDTLRADVLATLVVGQASGLDPYEARQRVRDDGAALHDTLQALGRIRLPSEMREQIRKTGELAQAYAVQAHQMVQAATADRSAALAGLPAFERQFKSARRALEEQGQALAGLSRIEQQQAGVEADAARRSLLGVCAATIVAASAFVAAVTGAIRRRLRRLGEVAQAIADGDLERRTGASGGDELGDLGRAIDQMASALSGMIGTMRGDAGRATFGKQLAEALDMADRESQVTQVAARAMTQIAAQHPMELLIADSSKAHMERAAEHPGAGAPGCGVASPYDCVAVRRGTVVGFDHSEALNACDHLRGRASGPVCAVCVPVTFMGRAIGVLHAAGPPAQPLKAEQAGQLASLGAQIGMRIGTVRAFEKSQIQASTDGLTGLPNRRTLERHLRTLSVGEAPFAVVMCDLDHFKLLNDSHGHAAGDTALRIFSDVLRHCLRETDLVGRWGGEEFAIVLPQAQSKAAEATVLRLRRRLEQTLLLGKAPRFTASYGIADSSMSRRPDELVKLADIALYQAKAEGRDRACVADPSIQSEDSFVRLPDGDGAAIDAAALAAEEA